MKTTTLPAGLLLLSIAFALPIIVAQRAMAQQVVQLSGLVMVADSAASAAGVAVYVPNTSRGTHTNESGFFSLPVLPGDSVVIAQLGFEKQYILIPKSVQHHSFSTKVCLVPSNITLPTVDVMPWATERDLRMAVANLKLPKEAKQAINSERLQEQAKRVVYPMDASANVNYGLQQQNRQFQSRHMVPTDIKLLSIPIR